METYETGNTPHVIASKPAKRVDAAIHEDGSREHTVGVDGHVGSLLAMTGIPEFHVIRSGCHKDVHFSLSVILNGVKNPVRYSQ